MPEITIVDPIIRPDICLRKEILIRLVVVIGCCCCCLASLAHKTDSSAQKKDTTPPRFFDRWKNNNIFQFFKNAFVKGRPDTLSNYQGISPLNTKSEKPFTPYEGKIIRHIFIRGYGFEQTFTDTARRLEYFGTRLLNHLHRKTHDWVIRDALYVK